VDGNKTAKTPSSQRETFAEYFKNLASPQDNQNLKDELLRDRPFNLWFFVSFRNLFPNVAEKNVLIFVEEKQII
jgi:hypothetical protein